MITLLNAAPDTGNQGVSALCHSVVAGLAKRGATALSVTDHGRGLRHADWDGTPVNLVGLTHNRRFWRGDSLRTAHALVRLGGGGSAPARTVVGSRAVLDISGGDSFTDLYGPRRFRAMILTKRMALNAGVPLILLPQKLGPFRDPAVRTEAVDPTPRHRRLGAGRRQLRLSSAGAGPGFRPRAPPTRRRRRRRSSRTDARGARPRTDGMAEPRARTFRWRV
jgi:hypothetical protein